MEGLKILITGGTGFIGANLARLFYSNGYEVSVTLREESNVWRIRDILKNLTLIKTDITDMQKVEELFRSVKPDIVINTAAFGGYPFEKDTDLIFKVNLNATINLVEAFLRSGSEIFINAGSSSEYGLKAKPMNEWDLLEPIGAYAVSKSASTLYCRSRSIETKRKIVTMRLFSPYGYFEEAHRLIPYVIYSSLKHKSAKLNNPSSVRDFIFIEDVYLAYSQLIKKIDSVDSGEIFNLGFGKEYRVEEIVNMVEKISGEKLNVEWQYGNDRVGDRTVHWVADITKITGTLQWKPMYSLEDGLSLTYYWFKKNISNYEVMENSKARKFGE